MIVYFVQGEHGGPVKIGVTVDIINRFRDLKHNCPIPLKILGILDGDIDREQAIHFQFQAFRLHGEWFSPHQSLIDFIAENTRTPILIRVPPKRVRRWINISAYDPSRKAIAVLREVRLFLESQNLDSSAFERASGLRIGTLNRIAACGRIGDPILSKVVAGLAAFARKASAEKAA